MTTLVRKTITDKNGVITTRLVNPDKGIAGASRIPGGPIVSKATVLLEPDITVPEPSAKGTVDSPDEKLDHTMFTHEGFEWSLAPDGFSGAYCYSCKSFFTEEEVDSVGDSGSLLCASCGANSDQGVLPSGVKYSDRKFFSKSAVRENTWYHITVRSDWGGDITAEDDVDEQPLVHLGSKDAALDRMQDLIEEAAASGISGDKAPKFYCYEVKVKPVASIADAVLADDNDMAPSKPSDMNLNYVISDGYDEYGVNRYVNEYESHGSISLLAHPSSFDIVSSYQVS